MVQPDPDIGAFGLSRIPLHGRIAQRPNGPDHMGEDAHHVLQVGMRVLARLAVQFRLKMRVPAIANRIGRDTDQAVGDAVPEFQGRHEAGAHLGEKFAMFGAFVTDGGLQTLSTCNFLRQGMRHGPACPVVQLFDALGDLAFNGRP